MKIWLKNTLAGTVFALGIGGTIAYSTWLRPILNDEVVYIATTTIAPNAVIERGDWTKARISRNVVPVGAVVSPSTLVGQMASTTIPQHGIFTASNIEKDPLAITPNTQDFQLSRSWISVVPDSLRRGNEVYMYLLPSTTPATPHNITQAETGAPFLSNIPVEFVHNGSNQEVLNANPPVSGDLGSRANGTAVPSDVELKLTNSQVSEVISAIAQKDKFILTYSIPT
ncbi:SAF domain-containing protein [Alicyclobacillus tolerans]|uniref:SAF domain-containing protein n=1 Tax=Alicyclobacillus tolerans TaxID=90970 RepID=UPI001F2F33B1|nr:SAF domain-containing protein [Alicyclobacillus tolerans]MCF8568150.1 SAF domain-containing protein [Alicyclobacillus tolerans]